MSGENFSNASTNVCIPRVVMSCALDSKYLNVCHVNIQSLCARQLSKFEEFKLCFHNSAIDIICLSETWLTDNIPDSLIEIEGYNMVRNDRIYSRGGGVCIYYKSFIKCRLLSASEIILGDGDTCRTEFIFVEIMHHSNKFLLGVCYNPPGTDCSGVMFNKLADLSLQYENVLLLGDFNTNWNKTDSKTEQLKSCLEYYGLKCLNSLNTHYFNGGSSLIDLVLTNNSEFVLNLNQVSAPAFSKHDVLFCTINVNKVEEEVNGVYRDYSRINVPRLVEAFDSINWNLLYTINDTDLALNFFNIQLIRLFNEFVPVRTFKPKKNPWFNHEIASAIVERNIAYRLWIADRTAFNHNQFKRMRNKVTSLINNAKTRYVSNNFTASNSSKDLWKRIKNLNITKPSDCSNKFDNNNDEINDYFCSNFTSDEELLPVPPSNEYGFKFSEILHDDIIIAINSIKSNAVGLDEIPLRFVKLLFPSICPMIHYIFNLIISTSKFPQAWKTSKVIPIKKKARTLSLDNLRPISILCAISKIFERILKNQIQAHIESFGLLHPFQSGFRKQHSTTSAFLKVHNDIHSAIDKKGVAFLFLIDFSKAFDRVSHTKLLKKLSSQFLFSRSAVNLMQSYLTNRSQTVFADGVYSKTSPIMSGVPQGSILGPLLFSCFINDLPNALKYCQIHMFADDVQLYFTLDKGNISWMSRLISADLANVMSWANKNLLPINASKTKVMFISRHTHIDSLPIFYLGDDKLEYVDKVSNLGFIIQNNLEWDSHVNNMCGKIYGGLRLLKLSSNMLPTNVKLQLFKSLLLPHLIYGDVFLLNASARAIDRLRIALNCCVRYVFNLSRFSSVSHLQSKLIGCPFHEFLKMRSCLTLFKIIRFSTPQYLHQILNPFQSLRIRNFITPSHNTAHYANTLFVRGIIYWNLLPNEIKNLNSFSSFQQECVKWFSRGNQH